MQLISHSMKPAIFSRVKAQAEKPGYGRRFARKKMLVLWMEYTARQ
jgi:hypothetical protein